MSFPYRQDLKYKILIKHKKVAQDELVRVPLHTSLIATTATPVRQAAIMCLRVCPPTQPGRVLTEPASSTVDLLSVQLDALAPLTPTRPKGHRLRRASVPGRLPVAALSGLGKEKKPNKKVLQSRRTSEGSSRPHSSPSSPDHTDPQTGNEKSSSSGEGDVTLSHSQESEGEGSKHPSCEDLKLSPRRGRRPLQKQDSSLSITSTNSDGKSMNCGTKPQ